MTQRVFALVFCVALHTTVLPCRPVEAVGTPVYESDIRPILKAHCFHCHGEGKKLRGGLDLRLRRLIARGGKSGAALAPGDPEESLLLRRLRAGEMPPGEERPKLSAEDIDTIAGWIAAGARTLRPEPAGVAVATFISEEERGFWAFRPIEGAEVPAVEHGDRVRTPVDAFLLAGLESVGLSFSADAGRTAILRRVFFDLTGLPPEPEDIAAFLADPSTDAHERLVDRLLASPRHGERWGRHWLDVAGYADSEGMTNDDTVREWVYQYRDYVIESFNADRPYDRFLREQLAGDEMLAKTGSTHQDLVPDDIEKLTATGFLRLAPDGTDSSEADNEGARNRVIADTIRIVSTAILGLTVECAQCHNHRYDPVSQEDYYRLRAIFEPAYDPKSWRRPRQRLVSLYTDGDRQRAKAVEAEAKKVEVVRSKKQAEFIQRTLQKELAKLPEEIRQSVRVARDTAAKDRTPQQEQLLKAHPSVNVTAGSLYLYDSKAADDLKKLADRAASIRLTKPRERFVRVLAEVAGKVPSTHVFRRGDHAQPGKEVEPASLPILAAVGAVTEIPRNDPALPTTGRRLAWARRLTDANHPLVARVIVNRVWMHHFGRGIVATPGDFGALGARPSHPALLDWLAVEFMKSGWSLKRLHRLIMTSTAYRQQTWRDTGQGDVENRLYGGFPVKRLEAEAVRDAILAVSGALNLQPFGPAVPVIADRVGQFVLGIENLNAGRPGPVLPMHGQEFRRSVYVQMRRSRPLSMLDAFDAPRMEPNCEIRASSTVAPQALMLMNGDLIIAQSQRFARRVRREAGDDPRQQITRAWLLALGRGPDEGELAGAVAFLDEQAHHFEERGKQEKDTKKKVDPRSRALASFCQTLLSCNEFLYTD